MLTEKQITAILTAPKVTAELADAVGVGIHYIYRLRRRHGVKNDLRFKTDEERILRYSQSSEGCWDWNGSLGHNGYGRLGEWRGETSAHRASYVFHFGAIDDGMSVLHSCDNRRCINPKHLRLGTYSDNQNDAYRRNRRPIYRGSNNSNAKLTEQQAEAILSDSRKQVVLAVEYGVSISLVSAIKRGSAWKHLRTNSATERAKMNLR